MVKLLPSLTDVVELLKLNVCTDVSLIVTSIESALLFKVNVNISAPSSVVKSSVTLNVLVAVLLLIVKLPVKDSVISLAFIPVMV